MNVIEKLVELIVSLYQETEDYGDNPSDVQLWYNRGYANGIVSTLNARGYANSIKHISLDAEDLYSGEQVMEWHKAYHHGFEVGLSEAKEVTIDNHDNSSH